MPVKEASMGLLTDGNEEMRPLIGVAVVIRDKEGRILLGKRKNVTNAGLWSLPGGHFEWWETFDHCARRETREEAGIEISTPIPLTFSNDRIEKENKHYVTLYFLADWVSGEVKNREPEKCEGWQWFDPCRLPDPTWDSVRDVLNAMEERKRALVMSKMGEDGDLCGEEDEYDPFGSCDDLDDEAW